MLPDSATQIACDELGDRERKRRAPAEHVLQPAAEPRPDPREHEPIGEEANDPLAERQCLAAIATRSAARKPSATSPERTSSTRTPTSAYVTHDARAVAALPVQRTLGVLAEAGLGELHQRFAT